MPVDSEHPDYTANLEKWQKCRVCVEGEEAVKAAGFTYLPGLSGQTQPEYDAYRMRASFFGATERTLEVMSGMIFRKEPNIVWPDGRKEIIDYVTADYRSIETFAKVVVQEVFTTGRYGVLVDMPKTEEGAPAGTQARPYLCGHIAEAIINWQYALIDGRLQLVYVALREMSETRDPADGYAVNYSEQIRVLKLDELDGYKYKVEIHVPADNSAEATGTTPKGKGKKAAQAQLQQVSKAITKRWVQKETYVPTRAGVPFKSIPFTFIGATDLTAEVDKPPMLGVANVNLAHYRNSADLEHGRHFCGIPTPWAAGFKVKQGDVLTLGATRAWTTDEPNAKAGFLEFNGTGLGELSSGLKEKQQQMSVLGARMLEDDKLAAEAADTHRIRKSGENSVVANVAGTSSEGLTQSLQMLAEWLAMSDQVGIDLNREFFDTPMDSATLTTMMLMVQSGAMSWEVYFYNMQRGGMYPPGHTLEDEFAFIEMGGPVSDLAASGDPDPNDPNAPAPAPAKKSTGGKGAQRRKQASKA